MAVEQSGGVVCSRSQLGSAGAGAWVTRSTISCIFSSVIGLPTTRRRWLGMREAAPDAAPEAARRTRGSAPLASTNNRG